MFKRALLSFLLVLSLGIRVQDISASSVCGEDKSVMCNPSQPDHLSNAKDCKKTVDNPKAIKAFLNRIGGKGADSRFETTLDRSLITNGQDRFVIGSKKGKPYIQGSSYSALTTGINWYLNHYALINLSWNNLTTNLSQVTLPVPQKEESHTCDACYRYYLNYCTFAYSMTPWTWDRWEKEIDWMALHGINMPLQIVGLETVWRNYLMKDYGYSAKDAEAFVAGPAFMAWFGMNNLMGWGASHDEGWYARQATLAHKILTRERELGMEPVLPGFSGMVPSNFDNAENQGNWCDGFVRPYILDPTASNFSTAAAKYYARLQEVMGTSKYYSMDPFHEGGRISSGKYSEGYTAIYNAMNENCGADAKWVIQQWQWTRNQQTALTSVPAGRLIVLDLFSDGSPAFDHFNGYEPQEAVYCAIPNYGGRTGFFGRIPKMANNYFSYKAKYSSIRGIGAAPEAIEQTPVVYDLLFELPWMGSEPNTEQWMKDYTKARYGKQDRNARSAWEVLRSSALNNTSTLQGPHEAVICARPSLHVTEVSTWGGTDIFYDQDKVVDAAFQLLAMGEPSGAVSASNYNYDLCDITRQALTDYSKSLLAAIDSASKDTKSEAFTVRRDAFLGLILDIDSLLGSNQMFRLGNWTASARAAAKEIKGYNPETQDWLELDNARTLIASWSGIDGCLNNYSYREWQGMLRDYYYPRWKYWFDHNMTAPESWFYTEWNWAHELEGNVGATAIRTQKKAHRTYYSAQPEGNTYSIAKTLLNKYFAKAEKSDGATYYKRYLIN